MCIDDEGCALDWEVVYFSRAGRVTIKGISVKKLAEKTGLSVRRIYKYLRGLKGKKLVFTRKTPRSYSLTAKGKKLAYLLQELQNLVEETWSSSKQVVRSEKS